MRDRLPATPYRPGLLLVGIAQLTVSAQALLMPRSFRDDFPLGRGWVETLSPAYDEHLIYDYGSFTLGAALGLVLAAVWLDRRVVQLAIISWLAGASIHFGYHLTTIDEYSTADNLGSLGALLLYVVVPAALLWKTRRDDGAHAESPGSSRARPAP